MAAIGYARVSTQDQDLTAQLDAFRKAGARTVFREKVSGVRADRPQLAKLMASLTRGDVVVVCKLDRLGRSTRELLELIYRIDQAGAAFRSLGDPLFDTSTSQGRLLVTMLAAIAEFERERSESGRVRAGNERCRTAFASAANRSSATSSARRRWLAVVPEEPWPRSLVHTPSA
jgi:DNA invertase Pin-like site-specific DNA recombinase